MDADTWSTDTTTRRYPAHTINVCIQEVSAGPPAVLVPQDHRPADRGGDISGVPDIQRHAGPSQASAEQPGPQEAREPAGARDQVDGLADDRLLNRN
jgi:hypothetical protein